MDINFSLSFSLSTFLFLAFVCHLSGLVRSQQGINTKAHGHGHVGGEKPSLSEDASHIKEHLKEMMDMDTSTMTPAELDFHYFKLHDFDRNNKLDGLEMLQALMHNVYDHDPNNVNPKYVSSEPIEITVYTDLIDQVLKDDDLDNDGYLSYEEYKHRVEPI